MSRAVTLKRYPNGSDGIFFYEKNCPAHRPDWVPTVNVPSDSRAGGVNYCLLNDVATRRYMRGKDLVLLVVVALIENCGYRQLNTWWSFVGTVQAVTGKGGWGTMKRQALGRPRPRTDFLRRDFPESGQREIALSFARSFGYDDYRHSLG